MDANLYDEFGNYVGPEMGSSDDDDDVARRDESRDDRAAAATNAAREDAHDASDASEDDAMDDDDLNASAITLAEDKKYYPTAEEVYGEGTETLVENEDAQALETPIVAPVKVKNIEAAGQRYVGGSVGAQVAVARRGGRHEGERGVPGGLARGIAKNGTQRVRGGTFASRENDAV